MAATIIIGPHSRDTAKKWLSVAPDGTVITFKRPGRTTPQNDRMWAMLTDVATQAEHNGRKYTADQWKCLFMNACGHETHFMPGLNGEPFPAGFRSSKMNKDQMTELMDFIEAWGVQNGVNFKETA